MIGKGVSLELMRLLLVVYQMLTNVQKFSQTQLIQVDNATKQIVQYSHLQNQNEISFQVINMLLVMR